MSSPLGAPAIPRRKSQDGEGDEKVTYHSYLKLDKILNAQEMKSSSKGNPPIHDEHLFIITHQAFELWFRQILHDVNSVRAILSKENFDERDNLCMVMRLNRVIAIMKLCRDKFCVLETMPPRDFLDFREFLKSGSGFQSLQFRLIEIRLGVVNVPIVGNVLLSSSHLANCAGQELRESCNKQHFLEALTDGQQREQAETAMSEPSLLDLIDRWLSRAPGLQSDAFDFWNEYEASVRSILDEAFWKIELGEDENTRKSSQKRYEADEKAFELIFDEKKHNKLLKENKRRLTHKATQGALMICLYRDEPRLHSPFQLLQTLVELDAQFMKLRYTHSLMVQRMVGNKVGTGGSTGYKYLSSTCSDDYKIFLDLMNIASYLLPQNRTPPLNPKIKRLLSFEDIPLRTEQSAGRDDETANAN